MSFINIKWVHRYATIFATIVAYRWTHLILINVNLVQQDATIQGLDVTLFYLYMHFLCSVWWAIFIGFADWLHWDPDSRTLPVYSISDCSKTKASRPLSPGSGICCISWSCVVSAGSSTCTTDSCSPGRQAISTRTETYSMYNVHDQIM
jgi:hypothetical protein